MIKKLTCSFFLSAILVFAQGMPFPGSGMTHATSSWTVTNGATGAASGATGSPNLSAAAFSNPLTNGSLIVCLMYNSASADTLTCTDTATNTYSDANCGTIGKALWSSSSLEVQALCAINSHTTSSNVVTMNSSVATDYPRIIAFEIIGGSATPVSVAAKAENQTSAPNGNDNMTASITTAVTNSMVICMFSGGADGATVGVVPPFNLIAQQNGVVAEWLEVAATGAYQCRGTIPGSSIAFGAVMLSLTH